MDAYFLLSFKTDTNEIFTVRVPSGNVDVTAAKVNEAMNLMIFADAFPEKYGSTTTKVKAELIKVSSEPVEM